MADRPRFRVEIAPGRLVDERFRRSATLTSPELGERALWFEVEASDADRVGTRGDPFVLATLVLAMREGLPLEVSGAPVDAGLWRHLVEFQRIWDAWFGYTPVPVHAEVAAPTDPPPDAVVAFSGGADSAFSAWWHTRGDGGDDPPLRGAMMLRGIDIPLRDAKGFSSAAARARRMTESLGLDLTVVSTNAWELPVPIRHFTGMGVSSALHVLGGAYGAGLLPSTASYPELVVPLNSSPVSDWLLGGSAFAILHDGARYNRFEKLRALAAWPEAMGALRVCLDDPAHDRNCGTCHKCMMTLAAFRILGVTAGCFDTTPSPADLTAWAKQLPSGRYYQQEGMVLVDEARALGVDEPWVRVLRNRIRVTQLKDGVRGAWPGLADGAARVHRRVATLLPGRS